MPRDLTPDMLAKLQGDRLAPVVFVYAEFLSGPVYAWSGIGTKSWSGQDWKGLGGLMQVSFPRESSEVTADNFSVSLSGIAADQLELALEECRQGKPVKIWLGAIADDGSIIADPQQAAAGRMDVPNIDEGPETSTITLTVESLLVDLQRPRERRYTDEDQQLEYPGDRGFFYVPKIQEWNRKW